MVGEFVTTARNTARKFRAADRARAGLERLYYRFVARLTGEKSEFDVDA